MNQLILETQMVQFYVVIKLDKFQLIDNSLEILKKIQYVLYIFLNA